MTEFDISNVPNQKFNTNINGRKSAFEFRTFRDIVYINVYVDDVLFCSGVKAVPNDSLFPSKVNEAAGGTFMFVSISDDYPSHTLFNGVACRFVFNPY